jgi:hypothetical protein
LIAQVVVNPLILESVLMKNILYKY